MIHSTWVILAVVLLTAILIIVVVIIDPNVTFPKKQSRKISTVKENENYSKKEVEAEFGKPGKILVSDSTYEILIEEKKNRK